MLHSELYPNYKYQPRKKDKKPQNIENSFSLTKPNLCNPNNAGKECKHVGCNNSSYVKNESFTSCLKKPMQYTETRTHCNNVFTESVHNFFPNHSSEMNPFIFYTGIEHLNPLNEPLNLSNVSHTYPPTPELSPTCSQRMCFDFEQKINVPLESAEHIPTLNSRHDFRFKDTQHLICASDKIQPQGNFYELGIEGKIKKFYQYN